MLCTCTPTLTSVEYYRPVAQATMEYNMYLFPYWSASDTIPYSCACHVSTKSCIIYQWRLD